VLRFNFTQKFRIGNWNLFDESHLNDHNKCLNQELAKWECIINENPCEEKSKDYLKRHLANPKENK